MGIHPVAHTAVSPHGRGWCVGVQQFAHTPLSTHAQGLVCGHLPSRPHARLISHTQVATCHVFCSVHGNCPSVLYKQVATLFFYPNMSVAMYFAGYTATSLVCLQADGNSLFFNRTCCFAMSFCSATRQLPSVSRWQFLRFSNHGNCSKTRPYMATV